MQRPGMDRGGWREAGEGDPKREQSEDQMKAGERVLSGSGSKCFWGGGISHTNTARRRRRRMKTEN